MISVRPVPADDAALVALGATGLPPRAVCLVAERDGAAVGCCALTGAAGSPDGTQLVRIDPLIVLPGAVGAERALLTAAERVAVRLGASAVLLPAYRTGIEVAGYRPADGGYRKPLARP
jgi:predicted N-acetyltransferase YhbS